MCSSSEFLQEFLDLSRNKENELKNGEMNLILTPNDVTYLQKVIEKGNAGRISGSLILTPNDTESMRNTLGSLKYFTVKSRKKIDLASVDFKYFSQVENLQLIKIQPGQLININALRPKLKTLKCYQSLKWLKEVLRSSEQNLDNAFWINLKRLEISYNNLEYFDDSLSLLSRLEVLNASHNKIKSCEGLKLLKDVTFINLGFNKLVEFPAFSPQTCDSLTHLVLRYNFIENLGGIQYLTHLSELDLGYNLLESHIVLAPLHELNNLSMVRLEGNPLAFFKKHRILTAVHLNNCILKSILLDGCSLSSKEIKESFLVGLRVNRLPFRRPLMSQPTPTEVRSFIQPEMNCSLNYSEDASVNSVNSDHEELIVEPIAKAYVKKKTKKQHKRETIESSNSHTIEENLQSSNTGSEKTEIAVEDHKEIKKQIEETRKELGDSWLLSASTILGTKQIISGSWKSQLSETESTNLKEAIVSQIEPIENFLVASSATESVQNILSNNDKSQDSTEDVFFSLTNDRETIIELNTSSSLEVNSDCSDENECESNLFIVSRNIEGKETSIVLSVGSRIFLEKDGLSGKPIENWNLDNLISAQEIQESENVFVQLEFDVVRKDKRERTYVVDDLETAKTLLALLENFVEARNLKEMSKGLTQCLKCDFKFRNSEADHVVLKTNASEELKEIDACPKCKSTFLVDSEPINSVVNMETDPSSYSSGSRIHSFFQSRNSAKSLEDSGSVGKNSRPRSVSEEMQVQRKAISLSPSRLENTKGESSDVASCSSSSVDCISLNPDENTPHNTVKLVYDRELSRRSESDITVLSNPSQSSIAIISTTSSSVEQINTVGGLDVIYEQDIFSNTRPTLGIYDSGSTSDTFYSANFNSPVAKLKDYSKSEIGMGLNSSGEISWYDSASAETYINLSQDTMRNTKIDEKDARKFVDETIDESLEIEDHAKQIWEELDEPISISLDEFLQLDHRIRLKLEVETFGDGEEFHASIKARISTCSKLNFDGIAVFSNKNVFLFSPIILGDSIQLMNLNIHDISTLRSVSTLLGSQAVCFIHIDVGYALNLGDADLCNSFITYIEDIIKSKLKFSEVSFIQSTEKDLLNVKNEILMSDLITSVIENSDVEIELFLIVSLLGCQEQMALVVTENSLSLAEIQYFLKRDSSDTHFVLKDKQLISSLITLHISKDAKTVGLHFLDEDENTKTYWVLETKSKSSLSSLLLILRKHWENIFLIDLQITIVSKCLSCGYQE